MVVKENNSMDKQILKERFVRDVGCTATHYRLDEIWDTVWDSYREPQRHYHNMQHIVECLDLLDKHFGNYPRVCCALWFHDVVYQCPSGAISNEDLSAVWAANALRTVDGLSAVYKIAELIRSTTYKQPPVGEDERVFHDIDFAILGAEQKRFSAYCAGINYEYNWVHPEVFVKNREAFLRALLDREHIYYTDTIRALCEKQARENITRELEDPSWAA